MGFLLFPLTTGTFSATPATTACRYCMPDDMDPSTQAQEQLFAKSGCLKLHSVAALEGAGIPDLTSAQAAMHCRSPYPHRECTVREAVMMSAAAAAQFLLLRIADGAAPFHSERICLSAVECTLNVIPEVPQLSLH